MTEVLNGSVKWFDTEKGFGFIQAKDGSGDVFVHFSQVKNENPGRVSLGEGQEVEYTIGEGRKGPQAENVVAV